MTLSERVLPVLVRSDTPPRRGIFVALMVAAVPALDIVVDHGGSVPTFLLFCFGIGASVRHRLWRTLGVHEWWLIGIIASYCAVSVIWAGYGGWTERGLDKMNEHLRLIQFIPIYMLLRHVVLRQDVLWMGFIIGAIGAGVSGVIEVAWLGKSRAAGANNLIHFGNISIIMAFAALAAVPVYARRNRVWGTLPWLALIAGVMACLLSGTRGSMLFLPVGLVLSVGYFAPILGRRAVALLVLLPTLAIGGTLAVPNSQLGNRIEQTVENLSAYEPGGAKSGTSVGLRLDMWITSAKVIARHPVLGVGLGRFREAMQPYVDRGEANPRVMNFDHAHNAYITTQLSRGLAGTLVLLLILGMPLAKGLRGMWVGSGRMRAYAYAVVVVAAGYATHAIANNIFERGVSLSFFVVAMAAAAAGLENARRAAIAVE